MNFLILRNFSKSFLNFSKFILYLFGFKKKHYRALMWQLTQRQSDVSPCGDVYTCHVVHVCVYGCACVRMSTRVCACLGVCAQSVITGLSIHRGLLLTHYMHFTYLPVKSCLFLSCRTIFLFISSQVT